MENNKPDDGTPIFMQQQNWREELQLIIRKVVQDELKNYSHECRFAVTDKEAKELGHCIGMISDLGDGRIGGGVELIRDNHKWLKSQRDRGEKISTAFLFILISTTVGGMLTALWLGVKHAILGIK